MPATEPTETTETIARIGVLLTERGPTLGAGRLVCIDGPAGAGKTMLAAALGEQHPAAAVVHLDDLYEGWAGLPGVGARLDALLLPLSRGEAGHYRRYDWHRGAQAETVTVEPSPLLVLEGTGSGCLAHPEWATVTVWVTAPAQVRRRRALARDGDVFAPHWDSWAAAEEQLFAAWQVAARADLVVGDSPTPH